MSRDASVHKLAPTLSLYHPLPSFVAIEYPGPVSSSHASVETALEALGGLSRVSQSLNSSDPDKAIIELNLGNKAARAANFSHPIPGETVNTSNLVLKVTRRRRKRRKAAAVQDGDLSIQLDEKDEKGYTLEIAGVIRRTIRFRGNRYSVQPPYLMTVFSHG